LSDVPPIRDDRAMSSSDALPSDPEARPVLVHVAPEGAAQLLLELLLDYQATLEVGKEHSTLSIVPLDRLRRGTVIYRVIQASRTIADRFPGSTLFLITENGERWRLPPPAL
jgi:hypothetical protein